MDFVHQQLRNWNFTLILWNDTQQGCIRILTYFFECINFIVDQVTGNDQYESGNKTNDQAGTEYKRTIRINRNTG
ncbi:MAG: hypothetical protein IPP46_03710 [Bacteroidetes bacterium]|nr:hypothetical protein [Bacteroidota bacterium]